MYHKNAATTLLRRKTYGKVGLTTYIDYLETIGSISGVHRAGSGKEKGNCQDLVYLNIFFLFLLDHIPATFR
jgi:hypothetical protein